MSQMDDWRGRDPSSPRPEGAGGWGRPDISAADVSAASLALHPPPSPTHQWESKFRASPQAGAVAALTSAGVSQGASGRPPRTSIRSGLPQEAQQAPTPAIAQPQGSRRAPRTTGAARPSDPPHGPTSRARPPAGRGGCPQPGANNKIEGIGLPVPSSGVCFSAGGQAAREGKIRGFRLARQQGARRI